MSQSLDTQNTTALDSPDSKTGPKSCVPDTVQSLCLVVGISILMFPPESTHFRSIDSAKCLFLKSLNGFLNPPITARNLLRCR